MSISFINLVTEKKIPENDHLLKPIYLISPTLLSKNNILNELAHDVKLIGKVELHTQA